MFKNLPLGRGLLAQRDIEAGETFYTILQSGIDVEVAKRNEVADFSGFHLNENDCLVPCRRRLSDKPHLFFVQHHKIGNVEVCGPLTRHLPT